MMRFTRMALAAGSAALLAGAVGPHAGASRSGDALAVRTWSGWETWWRRDAAPVSWNAEAPLAGRVQWRQTEPGIEWGELQLRGASEAWRTRVVVVRLDPARVDLTLDPAFTRNFNPYAGGGLPSNSIAQGAFYEPLIVVPAGGRKTLLADVPPLPSSGSYRVEWRLIGPDGHAVTGAYSFTVDSIVRQESGRLPGPALQRGGALPPAVVAAGSPLQQSMRFLWIAALLLVFGSTSLSLAVLPRLRVNAAGQEGVFQRSVDERLRAWTVTGAWLLLTLAVVRLPHPLSGSQGEYDSVGDRRRGRRDHVA